jgi:hypothetical protein
MTNKIFLVPCNYRFGCATVIALAEDGELLGSEFGGIFGNGFCNGAIPLRDDEEYLSKYESKYGKYNYELLYVEENFQYNSELDLAISKCDALSRC